MTWRIFHWAQKEGEEAPTKENTDKRSSIKSNKHSNPKHQFSFKTSLHQTIPSPKQFCIFRIFRIAAILPRKTSPRHSLNRSCIFCIATIFLPNNSAPSASQLFFFNPFLIQATPASSASQHFLFKAFLQNNPASYTSQHSFSSGDSCKTILHPLHQHTTHQRIFASMQFCIFYINTRQQGNINSSSSSTRLEATRGERRRIQWQWRKGRKGHSGLDYNNDRHGGEEAPTSTGTSGGLTGTERGGGSLGRRKGDRPAGLDTNSGEGAPSEPWRRRPHWAKRHDRGMAVKKHPPPK